MANKSWLDIPESSPFSLENIPFGVFSTTPNGTRKCCTRIGDFVLDLHALSSTNILNQNGKVSLDDVLKQPNLNAFAALGRSTIEATRNNIKDLMTTPGVTNHIRPCLHPIGDVYLHLPMAIGEYTDFLTSKEHAYNAARVMFRGKEDMIKLPPAFFTQPIGYHGRASSVVISGTDITRPLNSSMNRETGEVAYGPSKALDYEIELGYFLNTGNEMGTPVAVEKAEQHIFGAVLVNDWSARDHQGFEMVPLGPFNGKNFGTSISPWIVTMGALEKFRCELPTREGAEAPYLQSNGSKGVNIAIEAHINGSLVSQTSSSHLYFSPAQLLAHHTVGGCNMGCGDLLATGTISVEAPHAVGCLLEATDGGMKPLTLKKGAETEAESRGYLLDGDVVTFTAFAGGKESGVGFGECTGKIVARRVD